METVALAPRYIVYATLALALALIFRMRYVLALPLWISFFVSSATIICLASILRRPHRTSPAYRRRYGLHTLSFTTPSAWSAVEIRQQWEESRPTGANQASTPNETSPSRLDEVLRLVKESFILPWYNRISPSPAFPNAVETLVRQTLANIATRSETVDWSALLVSKIVPLVTDHIRHYRSVEHLASTSSAHSSLPLPLPRGAHPALKQEAHLSSKTPLVEIESHLRNTLETIVEEVLPKGHATPVVRTIVREVVLGAVILPVFEMLCDSDFWNRQIDERGGKYLHEQKQVNRFLSALSTIPPPPGSAATSRQNSPRTTKTAPPTTSISAASSTRQFESFLRSIPKVKTLGEARRLRADIEREQRLAQHSAADESKREVHDKEDEERHKRTKKYLKRLDRAKLEIEARIAALSGSRAKNPPNMAPQRLHTASVVETSRQPNLDLRAVLADSSTSGYWLEYMERRGRSRLVQFWMTIEGFKDPLEMLDQPLAASDVDIAPLPNSTSAAPTAKEDLVLLHDVYLNGSDVETTLPVKDVAIIRQLVSQSEWSSADVRKAKQAMFACQRSVFDQMLDQDWDGFAKSELFVKASADWSKGANGRSNSTDLPTIMSPISAIPSRPAKTPARRDTAPPLVSRKLEGRMPKSPPLKALPSFFGNYFSPSHATTSTGTPSIDPWDFEPDGIRPRIERAGSAEEELRASIGSLSPTPGNLARRPTQLDTLMDLDNGSPTGDRNPLFGDDDNEPTVDEEEEEFVQVERMEAIQAALNDIIADNDMSSSRVSRREDTPDPDISRSPASSMILVRPSDSTEPLGKMTSRSVEDLKYQPKRPTTSAPHSRIPSAKPAIPLRSSSSELKSRSQTLFDDTPIDDDERDVAVDVEDGTIRPSLPGNVELGVEIARLQDRIQDLVKQEHLLESLIRQAELTGNSAELRILQRSQASVRREQRTAIFQKAQFEQEEEQSRIVPGQTTVSIPTAVVTSEDVGGGKQVVRYTIEVLQRVEGSHAWTVAKRYSEFWDLDRALRDSPGSSGIPRLIREIPELPPKKLVPDLSASFIEKRRKGLEIYLQSLISSPRLCETTHLRNFLSRNAVVTIDATVNPSNGLTALAPHNIVKSLYKTMATSLDENVLGPNMLDMMYNTLSRQLNDFGGIVGLGSEEIAGLGNSFLPQALRPGAPRDGDEVVSPSTTQTATSGPLGPETGSGFFTAPICDLFIELFDLKENNWLRRQAIAVILQQFLGSTIERKVRDTIKQASSPASVDQSLASLQETLWPGGIRRPPSVPRTEEEKVQTTHRAGRTMGLLIPDVVANMIGKGNARRGARRVFGVLQDRRLNQHLMLSIMDELLRGMFPVLKDGKTRRQQTPGAA